MGNDINSDDLTSVPLILIMGVSGSGKTTIGRMLAEELGGSLIDADKYHPKENVKKMTMGIPLNDEDRLPWLDRILYITNNSRASRPLILACSALKKSYRKHLKLDDTPIIFLTGPYDVIKERLTARRGHFMSNQLLNNQFEVLEEPDNAIVISIIKTPKEILNILINSLQEKVK